MKGGATGPLVKLIYVLKQDSPFEVPITGITVTAER